MIPFFSERKFYFREDIFLTTKLRPADLGGTRCRYAVARFLEELGTNYLDLLLIHAPTVPAILSMAPTPYQQVLLILLGSMKQSHPPLPPPKAKLRAETWQCMQELQKQGVLRSIGVSNYDVALLQEVVNLGGAPPQVTSALQNEMISLFKVNQVLITPRYPQNDLLSVAHALGVHLQVFQIT